MEKGPVNTSPNTVGSDLYLIQTQSDNDTSRIYELVGSVGEGSFYFIVILLNFD